MRRVLFLAYHFPPLGGAGVQRTVHFVRRLPPLGFEPVVVTGPAPPEQTWPPQDPSLATLLRPPLQVVRVEQELEPKARTRLAILANRVLRRPSAFGRAWIAGSFEAGLRVSRDRPVDLVLATMSPFGSAEVADRLSRALRVPWVADLRDPWALDEVMVYPSRWHRNAEFQRMRRGLASAAAIVMNTPEASRALRQTFPEFQPERVFTITNGYDPDDFVGPEPRRGDRRFRVVHTGHLHTALGLRHRRSRAIRRVLGGERVPVDLLTRSHIFLLRALARWESEQPGLSDRVEVVLAGPVNSTDRQVVARSRVASLVRFEGYLEHDRSIALLRSADLLFLPMQKLPRGERARIVPGKTYEYLGARRPILAAVPEGDARDYVLASGLGHVCEPDDVEGISRILRERYAAFCANECPPAAAPAFYQQFERGELARRLARVLEGVLSG